MPDKSTDNVTQSNLVTVVEAAEILGKSERTIRRLMSSGKIPVVKNNGRSLIQLAGYDGMAASDGNMPDKSYDNARQTTDPLVEALRDTIKRQDSEITHLRNENTNLMANWEKAMLMLPAPATRPGNNLVWWILAAVLAAALIIGGIAWLIK